jgi:hypothetical protein
MPRGSLIVPGNATALFWCHPSSRPRITLLRPLTNVGRADGIHRPVIRLPMRNQCSDAHNRVVDMLGKFIANRLPDLSVGLADEIVGGREPAEVGHRLQVPDDDAWLHACRHRFIITIFNADCLDPNQRWLSLAAPLIRARPRTATGGLACISLPSRYLIKLWPHDLLHYLSHEFDTRL